MTGTGLTLFQPGAAVPAHIAQYAEQHEANIEGRATTPSLSPEGKVWTIVLDGQKHRLQQRNNDGDTVPMSVMKFIVLDYNKQRGRAFYEGSYDPANASAPICWSDDGVAPHDSLPGPFPAGTVIEAGKSYKKSAACANCPLSVKGSKIGDNGKQLTACTQHRMLAVIPAPDLGLPEALVKPLRLKIAMTSDWDKQSPDQEQQGWLAWSNFVDWLLARQIKHSALLVVKAKFDPEAAYPKIFFSAERYLTEAEMAVITPLTKDPEVLKLLGGTWTPAGGDGVPVTQQQTAAPVVDPTTAVAVAATVVADTAPVLAAAPPPEPVAAPAAPEPQYEMVDPAGHTMEQYLAGGWTVEQLVQHGKARIVGAVAAAPPPVEVAPAVVETVTAVEPAHVVTAAPIETVVVAQPVATAPSPAAEPSSPAVVAEVAPPVQAPAQVETVVAPATVAVAEPPAAAAAAAAAAPQVPTEVPGDVEELLAAWGPQ